MCAVFVSILINSSYAFHEKLGIDSRSAKRKMKKKKELFGDNSDPDLKRELASGQTQLISYTES
jgi:hypothetical protein